MDARVVELEIRVTYQDKIISDLDEVVQMFAERVEALERELGDLKRSVQSGTNEVGPASEKPPHY